MPKFKKILELLQNKSHTQLIENFISLSLLNGLNFLLPLITLPYIVRVIGSEKFVVYYFANMRNYQAIEIVGEYHHICRK
jgi:PST family polysaccharide transporter